jgi:UPF0716 protein FxsA
MFYYLVLLFTIVPIVEIYFLIKVGQHIGAFNTIIIVILAGIFGAALARMEGLRVLYGVQKDLQEGRMPSSQLLDGVLILAGAVFFIIPGLLTDVLGLLLVIPQSRTLVKVWLKKYLQEIVDKKEGVITVEGYSEDAEETSL